MRKKPRGRKYRNLYARGELIWFEKVVKGRRIRRSCKTSDWDLAAAPRPRPIPRNTGKLQVVPTVALLQLFQGGKTSPPSA